MASAKQLPTHGGPITEELDTFAQKVLEELHCSGLSVSWSDEQGTVATGYGFAQLPDKKANGDSVYSTASLTKSFTAMAALQLMEETKNSSSPITLQTTLKSVLGEDFVLRDEDMMNHATIEDALTHRTGMANHDFAIPANSTPKAECRRLRHLAPLAKLGEKHEYNNQLYVTMTHFIETATGMTQGQYMKKKIWDPLNMNNTYWHPDEVSAAESAGKTTMALPYWYNTTTNAFEEQEVTRNPANAGDGAICSSVTDYARYLQAVMNEDPRLLSTEHYLQLRTPRLENYGLGWDISTYHDVPIIQHTGGNQGYNTFMFYVPSRKWTLAIMANIEDRGSAAIDAVAYRILDDALGIPNDQRKDYVAEFFKENEEQQEKARNARSELYPDAPPPSAISPPSLPVENFTGRYFDEGYGNAMFYMDDVPSWWQGSEKRVLRADMVREFGHTFFLEHVHKDEYIARLWWSESQKQKNLSYENGQYLKARFVVEDGKVKRFGVKYVEELEELIYFEKV